MDTVLYYIVGVPVVFAALYLVTAYLGLGEYLKLRGLRFWERHFGRVTPGPADRERREPFEEKLAEIKPTIPLLPNPVADFTGRQDDIDKLVARLRNRQTAAITAIDGQGGVGKTELAYYVGREVREHYPDGQILLDLRGLDLEPVTPEGAMAGVSVRWSRNRNSPTRPSKSPASIRACWPSAASSSWPTTPRTATRCSP